MSQRAFHIRLASQAAFGALAFCLAVPAMAQDAEGAQEGAASAPKDEPRAEDIIVTGTRASLADAIDRKKKAGTVADSLVAEDIADFPDKNVGEALQRVTGIQLTREGGEGFQVSIRGVEPDLNRVEINGATTLGMQGPGSSDFGERGADFRELAAELVKSIDVFKGFTADMTEGGVGGTVSIQTRRPLDLKKPLLSLSGSMQYLETQKSWKPRGNLTAGTKLLDGRLGVMVNLTYDRAETRNDTIRNTAFSRFAGNADQTDLNNDNVRITPDARFDGQATPQECTSELTTSADRSACWLQFAEFVPRIPRYSTTVRDEERYSGVGTIQYQVTDNFDVFVEYQRNRRNTHFTDNHLIVDVQAITRLANSNNCAASSIPEADRCVIDESGTLIGFTTAPTAPSATTGSGRILQLQRRDAIFKQDSQYKTLGFNWNMDRIRITGLAVNSKGRTSNDPYFMQINANVPGIRVNLDPKSGNPSFTFPSNFDLNDPSSYMGAVPPDSVPVGSRPIVTQFTYQPQEVDVGEQNYKLDFDFEFDSRLFRTVEAGVQYRSSTTLQYTGGVNAGGTAIINENGDIVPGSDVRAEVRLGSSNVPLAFTNGSPFGNVVWTQARYQEFLNSATAYLPSTFFPTGDRSGIIDNWLVPNPTAGASFFPELKDYLNHDNLREVDGVPQIPVHDVKETIWGGYLKTNFDFDVGGIPLVGNIGGRYLITDVTSTGLRRLTAGGVSQAEIVTITNSYRDFLPSFNLMAEFIPDELIMRFGAAKVLARPKATNLSPRLVCTDGTTNDTCSAGNPNLKPYRANQYDLNLTWTPNRDTQLSAAVFYKDIKSFVLSSQFVGFVDVFGNGQLFELRQPINGQGAKIKGAEVSAQTAFTFLPAPFDGFGFQANYTYSKASDTGLVDQVTGGKLGFPGLSKHSYNLIGYYDKDWLNVRLAYNGRSSYLLNPLGSNSNAQVRDATGYLDGKITFRLKNFYNSTIFIEGKNLTKETERDTSSGVPNRMMNYQYSGRRFYVGASVRF